ncbi:hypothetical protein [Limosilactobacillus caccae]|uniref:hypothetical protein n=1 Tax=Limosilactobacillus caccae TaxID=1926284 RepID=UPI0009712775|nr:hypothetical protein [Limosilactobacillus caccae]
MIILISESAMNDKLVDIIEEQNSNYLGIITLVITLALAIFGIIQWKINDKKLNQLRTETIQKIAEKYDLSSLQKLKSEVDALKQKQDKAYFKLRSQDIEWLTKIQDSIELDVQKLIANDVEPVVQEEIVHNIFTKISMFIYKDFLYNEDKENTIYVIYSMLNNLKEDTPMLGKAYAEMLKDNEIMRIVRKRESNQ